MTSQGGLLLLCVCVFFAVAENMYSIHSSNSNVIVSS